MSGFFYSLLVDSKIYSNNKISQKPDENVIFVLKDFVEMNGRFPKNSNEYVNHTFEMLNKKKFSTREEAFKGAANFNSVTGVRVLKYTFKDIRPNGQSINAPKPKGSSDVVAYKPDDNFEAAGNDYHSYVEVIRDDFQQEAIPEDLTMVSVKAGGKIRVVFPREPGSDINTLSSQEYWFYKNGGIIPLQANYKLEDSSIEFNENLGSLIELSRRVIFPDAYGLKSNIVFKAFNLAQSGSSLQAMHIRAKEVGLLTQVEKLKVSELHQIGSPAILFLSDDGRLVTLLALDDNRAVIVDRGLTRNVQRSVLEERYSGEALIPTNALTQNAGIVADDAVREVKLPSLEAEVPQSVTLRNTGKVPVTLQLEYPLLGVTESKLSKDTLAPGETATLDLKIKWRSILKAPTQNVLVSLQTSDPIVPRLQLAFLLVPPTAAK